MIKETGTITPAQPFINQIGTLRLETEIPPHKNEAEKAVMTTAAVVATIRKAFQSGCDHRDLIEQLAVITGSDPQNVRQMIAVQPGELETYERTGIIPDCWRPAISEVIAAAEADCQAHLPRVTCIVRTR